MRMRGPYNVENILVTGALDLMFAHDHRLWETVCRRTCAVGFL